MSGCQSAEVTVLWLLLVYRFSTVSCQLKVHGCVGDDVLLPCLHRELSSLPETVSVFWRDRDDGVVLNFKQNVSKQDPKFGGRVLSDPQLYRTGNFSIIMKKVSLWDSGPYTCYVPAAGFQQSVSLSVSDQCVKAVLTPPPAPPAPPAPRPSGPSAGGMALTPNFITLLLLLLLLSSAVWSFH